MAQIARVGFFPKLLKKIAAMGCPMSLFNNASISVPMQKANAILTAHPRTPEIAMAPTIPQGTAVAALEASSLICTAESKEQMVQRGDKKL